ncbi:cobalamin-dependent protein [Paenibacillus sp. F411]|nr:cobalamin-dependent protein [Paenibacillus sp. F411]
MNMEIEHLAELMLEGLTEECWSLLVRHMDSGRNSLYIYDQLLTPAMRYIGGLWEQNLVSVADEHLASGVCDVMITRYAQQIKPAQGHGGRAMFLCVEGEYHHLGLKMVSSLFQERGFSTRLYGGNLPLENTMVSAMNWKPEIIGVSASIVYHLPTLMKYTQALQSLSYEPMIVIGGRLIDRYGLQNTLGERALFFPDLLSLNDWLRSYEAASRQAAAHFNMR